MTWSFYGVLEAKLTAKTKDQQSPRARDRWSGITNRKQTKLVIHQSNENKNFTVVIKPMPSIPKGVTASDIKL